MHQLSRFVSTVGLSVWGMLICVVCLVGLLSVGRAEAAPGGVPTCQAQLATCTNTLTSTLGNLARCTTALGNCQTDLDACEAEPRGQLSVTGQTQPYPAAKFTDSIAGPVDVPDDGTLQRGNPLRYEILQDGTVKDLNTGLIWEVKCSGLDCPTLHSTNVAYFWSGFDDRYTIWDWLDTVNAENNGAGYAGHTDWRIPNVRELESLLDYGRFSGDSQGSTAMIDPIFGPTSANFYWSSTTNAQIPSQAWAVHFGDGRRDAGFSGLKDNSFFPARAVRGGQ